MNLEDKLKDALGEAIISAIKDQLSSVWAFDNLDEVITDELSLLTKNLIREDPDIRQAVKERLLDVVDPLPDEEEEEQQQEEDVKPTPKKPAAKKPPAKKAPAKRGK